jgi:hypothetical protein
MHSFKNGLNKTREEREREKERERERENEENFDNRLLEVALISLTLLLGVLLTKLTAVKQTS